MEASHKSEAKYAAEIIAHLARLTYSDGSVGSLTKAQWTALRFFGTSSRFSHTMSAFADYHATTRGSASQTIKGLVAKGFLEQLPSKKDGRSVRIELTEEGRSCCEKDPFESLVQAIETLPDGVQASLSTVLDDVLAFLSADRQEKKLGTCSKCKFLKECFDNKRTETSFFCVHSQEVLSEPERRHICMNYQP